MMNLYEKEFNSEIIHFVNKLNYDKVISSLSLIYTLEKKYSILSYFLFLNWNLSFTTKMKFYMGSKIINIIF